MKPLTSKKRLLDLIKRRGRISLEAAVQELKLAKTTLRQHLTAMEEQQLVTREYQRTGRGRPTVVFTLAKEGQHLYPTQESALLKSLLEFLETSGHHERMQRFFENHWAGYHKKFDSILDSLPGKKMDVRVRLEALKILLTEEGFMPQIERKGQAVTVRECHCPFPETIKATKLPCQLELAFIRWALKRPVKRTQYIPNGDAACSYS